MSTAPSQSVIVHSLGDPILFVRRRRKQKILKPSALTDHCHGDRQLQLANGRRYLLVDHSRVDFFTLFPGP